MNALEYFEYRLESTKTDGANFRYPIDWQRYGPLFLDLFKISHLSNVAAIRTRRQAIEKLMEEEAR
jgi:hypothetical protein